MSHGLHGQGTKISEEEAHTKELNSEEKQQHINTGIITSEEKDHIEQGSGKITNQRQGNESFHPVSQHETSIKKNSQAYRNSQAGENIGKLLLESVLLLEDLL